MGALKGIIFDMDGVLVDSEEFIREAATRMFAEHGLTVQPEDFTPFIGAGEDRYIGGVAEKYGLSIGLPQAKDRTYEIYALIVRGHLEPLKGARDFIAKARAGGLKLAVASSADRVKVDINLHEIGLPSDAFDAIISGSDVRAKKPDPEIFLEAARRLGLPPGECIVVEDAVNGVQAAKAAGMRCLGITSTFSSDDLKAANWTAANLADAPPLDALRAEHS